MSDLAPEVPPVEPDETAAPPVAEDPPVEPTPEEIAADVDDDVVEVNYVVSVTRQVIKYSDLGAPDVDETTKSFSVDPDDYDEEGEILDALQEKFGEKLAELFDIVPTPVEAVVVDDAADASEDAATDATDEPDAGVADEE